VRACVCGVWENAPPFVGIPAREYVRMHADVIAPLGVVPPRITVQWCAGPRV